MQLEHPQTERLSAYLEHDLPEAEQAEVARHVEGCALCRAELEALQDLMGAFRALPELEAPPGFALRVMDRIEAQERRGFWAFLRRWKLAPILAPVAAATLVVIMLRNPQADRMPLPPGSSAEQEARDIVMPREAPPAFAPPPAASEGAPGAAPEVAQQLAAEAVQPAGAAAPDEAPADAPVVMKSAPTAAAPMPSDKLAKRESLEATAGARGAAPAPSSPLGGFLGPARLEQKAAPAEERVVPSETKLDAARPAPPSARQKSSGGEGLEAGDAREEMFGVGGSASAVKGRLGVGKDSASYGAGGPSVTNGSASGGAGVNAGGEAEKGARDRAGREQSGFAPAPPTAAAPARAPATVSRSASGAGAAPSGPPPAASATTEPAPPKQAATRGTAGDSAGSFAPPAPAGAEPASLADAAAERDDEAEAGATLETSLEVTSSGVGDAKAKKAETRASAEARPPDAIVALIDGPDRIRQVQRLVIELKGASLPPERLEGGVVRLKITLPAGAYPRLIERLQRVGALGATPAPRADRAQKVWIEISPR